MRKEDVIEYNSLVNNASKKLCVTHIKIADSQILRNCHFLWSWHFQRLPGWDWPVGAASPAPPSDNSNKTETSL